MKTLLVFILFILILMTLQKYSNYDDTDDKEKKERSGLVLYTDHKTGLQYIRGGLFGGILPRLNIDGTHMRKGD